MFWIRKSLRMPTIRVLTLITSTNVPTLQTLSRAKVLPCPSSVITLFQAAEQAKAQDSYFNRKQLSNIFQHTSIDLRIRIINTCPSIFLFTKDKLLELCNHFNPSLACAIIECCHARLTENDALLKFWDLKDPDFRYAIIQLYHPQFTEEQLTELLDHPGSRLKRIIIERYRAEFKKDQLTKLWDVAIYLLNVLSFGAVMHSSPKIY